MKNWKPKGFDAKAIAEKVMRPYGVTDFGVGGRSIPTLLVEAGADAMLGALKEHQSKRLIPLMGDKSQLMEFNPEYGFSSDMHGIQLKGTWVFIPDEGEVMYNKKTNIYTCSRCGMAGYPSVHAKYGDVCTGCANHLRLGDYDPLGNPVEHCQDGVREFKGKGYDKL